MKPSFLLRIFFGGILSCSQTYALENLAQNKEIIETPTQSTSYYKLYEAGNAINGKYEDAGERIACSITMGKTGIVTAWWKLPLKEICYVEYLLIYFRSSTVNRHVGFSVYVFNDTSFVPPSTGSGYPVFKQDTKNCPVRVMNITVSKLTKGIALYNSKNPPITTSCAGYASFATIEVCEVEVFGCISGFYGKDCDQRCGHCKEGTYCDIFSGKCPDGCNEKWIGSHCEECVEGFYGPTCSSECGHCEPETYCNSSTGICEKGCQEHWGGFTCDECEKGFYGDYCTHECGNCKNGTACNNSTGICEGGCHQHWNGSKCDVCEDGFFGPSCLQKCGHCKAGTFCNNITGICGEGCLENWNGSRCDACSNGVFGVYCNSTCGNCVNGTTCDTISGVCPEGCMASWSGLICNDCTNGLFGVNCNSTCGNCENGTTCDPSNGVCPQGCIAGWTGPMCDVCRYGFYGNDCSKTCGKCQTGTFCNNITGYCSFGCQEDWQGSKCDIHVSGAGQVVGATVGTLAVCTLVGIMFMLKYIRSRQSKNKGSSSVSFSRTDQEKADRKYVNFEYANISATTKHRLAQKLPDEENCYYNEENTCTDILVNELQMVIEKKNQGEPNVFYTEYKKLPVGDIKRCQVAQRSENTNKNRFKTTFPYDHSRVVLEEKWKDSEEDYIHANFIKDFKDEKRYIAAQGPTSKTLSDFWRLIWQENVQCIVMLTNLFESGKNKCVKYWPDHDECMDIGLCRISLLEEIKYAFYSVRRLSIQRTDSSRNRDVIQLHYSSWPDHGTPEELGLVQFHRAVTKRYKPGSPLLVHCSAGVGRTGTFIGYDSLLRQGKETGRINVFDFVKKMREDRMSMVQTKEQYTFLHKALVCGFLVDEKTINQADIEIKINKLLNDDSPQNQQTLYNEYKLLSRFKSEICKNSKEEESYVTSACSSNKADDKYRAYLTSYVKGRSNYINAVIVPSYTDLEGFIITHSPLPDTEIDLWRLCMDHEVDAVVVLTNTEDNWWLPKRGTSMECYPYNISNLDTGSDVRGVTQEELEVSVKEKRRIVLLYKIDPENQRHILQGVQFLLDKDMQNDLKTLVISKDGTGATGLFIAIHNILQKLHMDGDMDVFTTVKQIQARKPDVFNKLEDYRSCYQLVLDSRLEEVYANV